MSYTRHCRCGCFEGNHARRFEHGRNNWRECYRCACEQYEQACAATPPARPGRRSMTTRTLYGTTETGTHLHIIRETVGGCTRGRCGTVLVWVDPDQQAPGCPLIVCKRCLVTTGQEAERGERGS